MGLPAWSLGLMGAYYAVEIYMLHAHHAFNYYKPDEAGNYQLEYSMKSGFTWKMNQSQLWMTVHSVLASAAFFMWLPQLSDRARARLGWDFHRWNGRISLLLFLSTAWNTPRAAFNMDLHPFFQLCTAILGCLSLFYAVSAYYYIALAAPRNIPGHRQNALRLFCCSAAFVIFGRLWISLTYRIVKKKPLAQNLALGPLVITTVIVMESLVYHFEKGYTADGNAKHYKFLGLAPSPFGGGPASKARAPKAGAAARGGTSAEATKKTS